MRRSHERRVPTKRLAARDDAVVAAPTPSPAFPLRPEISSPSFHFHPASPPPPPPRPHNRNSPCSRTTLLEQLRSALDHKEEQIASLRRHSDDLLRSLKLKDIDVQHLQQAVEDRDLALLSREKLIDQTKQRLIFQRKAEKAQIDKKDLEIASLKAKSIRLDNKLIEQSKLLSALHNQKEKIQQDVYAYSQHVKKKVHKLKENLQVALASIQQKDEELEIQTKCIDDLKGEIWKKEWLLEHIKIEQEKLQYALDRKDMMCKQHEHRNQKLEDENLKIKKSLIDLKREFEKYSRLQESSMQRQREQIQTLEIALNKAELFIHANKLDLQTYNGEKMRLLKEHEPLNAKYELSTQDHVQSQMKLMDLEERMNFTQKYSSENGKQVDSVDFLPGEHHGQEQQDPEYPSLAAAGPSIIAGDESKHLSCEYSTMGVAEKYVDLARLRVNASNSCKHHLNVQSTTATKDDIPIDLSKKGERLNDLKDPSYMLSGSTISPRWLSVEANAAVSAPYSNCFSEINRVLTTVGDFVEDKSASNDTVHAVHSNASLELLKIEEEIKNRERSWKQIEARMRAELNRRASQVHEAEKGLWPLISKEI